MKGELDDRESVEDICHFCRGLVEEAEARDQSCSEEGNGKGGQSSVRGGEERRGKERDASFNTMVTSLLPPLRNHLYFLLCPYLLLVT